MHKSNHQDRLYLDALIKGGIASLLLYLFIEIFLFYYFLPYLPLQFQAFLHDGLRVLAQPSKSHTLPSNYIGVFGDSYAAGVGDWLASSNPLTNPIHGVSGLLHKQLDRDVVSFGVSGYGNIRAFTSGPIANLSYLNSTLIYSIPFPEQILLFFYEGNDLINNLREGRALSLGKIEESFPTQNQQIAFSHYISNVLLPNNKLFRESKDLTWQHQFYFTDMILRALISRKQYSQENSKPTNHYLTNKENIVKVGNELVYLKNNLQSPPLELTPLELQTSLTFVELSIAYTSRYFKNAEISLIYIPSPITSYNVLSKTISVMSFLNRNTRYKTKEAFDLSDLLAARLQKICANYNVHFLDIRGAFRRTTRHSILHGSLDSNHLNQNGYETLSKAIEKHLYPLLESTSKNS